jgi:hypothetical protein
VFQERDWEWPYFVKSVTIAAICDSNVIHLAESRDVEGVGVAVVQICITSTNGRVALVVVVRVRKTLTIAEKVADKLISGQWSGSVS